MASPGARPVLMAVAVVNMVSATPEPARPA